MIGRDIVGKRIGFVDKATENIKVLSNRFRLFLECEGGLLEILLL